MANKDTTEDQQRETSSPLPSYGMSKLCDIANPETVKNVIHGLSEGNLNLEKCQGTLNLENILRVHNPQETNNEEQMSGGHSSSFESSSSENANGDVDEKNENSIVMYYETQGQSVQDGSGDKVKLDLENSYVQLQMLLGGYSLGSTECIQTTTLDMINQQQLQVAETEISEDQLFGEGGVAMEVTVEEGPDISGFLEPTITFTDVAKYSRFRYESERTKVQKSMKCKNLDHSDGYKNLGTIKIEGYHGQAKLIIFCVDSQDRIHPYSLHGEFCEDGIYQRHFDDLNSIRTIKLNKVTFTTPKSKQYKDIFQKRRQDLEDLDIDTNKMHNTEMEKSDKNTVYLHAEVIFPDAQARKYAVSTAIHNKKEGHEFKIYTIEPASAPATGFHRGNPNKNRVLIVLTEATACPKNLAVKIKSKTGPPWEKQISKNNLKVIRKSVIEFYPPPFENQATDTNEECEITLLDLDTNDETDPVTFVYHSVKDQEGIEERKRKKPRLDTSALPRVSRQTSSCVSLDVLASLDQNKKRPRAVSGTRQSTELKPEIPRYTDVYIDKSNPKTSEKVYSLRDSSRKEDLVPVPLRASSSTVRPTENGNGSNVVSRLVQMQSTAGRLDQSEIQPSQLDLSLPAKTTNWQTVTLETPSKPTVSLPAKTINWEGAIYETYSQPTVSLPGKTTDWQGMTYETQNFAAPAQTPSSTVVTSASNFSFDRQAVTSTPMTAPLSAGFQPTLTPVAFPPNISLATPSFPSSTTTTEVQQQQPLSQNIQQLQTLLQQIQQTQQMETNPMADHERQKVILQQQAEIQQQVILQKQADELREREKQVQAREQMLQQTMQQIATEQQSQQQWNQQQQPQQQQQQQLPIQQAVTEPKPQVDQTAAMKEKRLKHEVLSAYFEKEAQKMNPRFKLPPSQMFLLLGDKITIADRSLVDIVFPSAGPQTSLNVDSLLQTLVNQSTASPLGGASIYTEPVQSAKVASQFNVPNQASAHQAPPVAQQLSLPQLQNMSAQLAGNFNPFEVRASVPSQQLNTGTPQLQAGNRVVGSSVGNQLLSTLGLRTRTTQSSSQSGRSIFPRNNLPFSAANLDDDDVEIDSEGLKRKKPVQLYGKSAKKQANGFNMKNGVNMNNDLSMQEEAVVIDLTLDTKNKSHYLSTDLNDNDLETDCFELKTDKLNAYNESVKDEWQIDKLSKIEKNKKLSGLHVGGKVRAEDDVNEEITQTDDSGVFSIEEQET